MSSQTSGLGPILTAHLFSELDDRLLELLRSLDAADWHRPTIAGAWRVRDVAAHLLDTALRRLSFGRDGCLPAGPPIERDQDLVTRVDRLNSAGVEVYGRLSPRVLIALTAATVPHLSEYFTSLDPLARATFPVSWAGDAESPNWFDVARELTERWHHQQQIRIAVDRPGILTPRLYSPVLDCFMRGLPHAYRHVRAAPGSAARIIVSGECGGTWHLERQADHWTLLSPGDRDGVMATTTIPQEVAWRVFTKGMSQADARVRCSIEGDDRVGSAALAMVSIVG